MIVSLLGEGKRVKPMTASSVTSMEQTRGCEPNSGYSIRKVSLDQDLNGLLDSWRRCNSGFHDHTIHCDPDWLQAHYHRQLQDVHAYLCERDGIMVGAVPFLSAKQPLLCQLGDFPVAKLPLRVLRLQGYTPNIPAEESAYDALFRSILSTRFDAIFMNYVKADSFLWNYLHTSPLMRKSFRLFSQRGPEPHLLARLDGSFETYMQKFSAKARKNRLREIRKLRDRGDVQLIRVTGESEVDSYLAAATDISRKTWQFKRLGWGVAAWDGDAQRDQMKFLARRGWLRSYLLKCDGEACSYILGWQYASRFYHAVIGFDPEWNDYSVGTVLQLLVLEDLYKENTPELYDFGTFAEYKAHLSTESYLEAVVWLFRRRPYPLFANGLQRAFSLASRKTGILLNKVGLRARVKRLLREAPGQR